MLAAWAKMHCGTIMLVAISFTLGTVLSSRTSEWIWWNTCSPELFSRRRRRSRHSSVPPPHLQIRRSSTSSHPSPSSLDQKSAYLILPQTSFSGILARPFESWAHPLPCFPPEEDWMTQAVQDSPTATGFLYVKPFKAGSSTTSGISLRIARNVALRSPSFNFNTCQSRFGHGPAFPAHALFRNRSKDQSFLWSVIRDPTKRAVSEFFHFEVSRKKVEPTDAQFKSFVANRRTILTDYYYQTLHTSSRFNRTQEDPIEAVNKILSAYNFIGITERMDESAVVLMMLLDLPMSDVLFLSAKAKGGYDAGRGGLGCTYIWPSFVSTAMQTYFDTDEEWLDIIQYDLALYQAVNASLDLTIDRLGREAFQVKLQEFRQAQDEAQRRCLSNAVFPCDAGGAFHESTDCLWKDSGCGTTCLDELAEKLSLS